MSKQDDLQQRRSKLSPDKQGLLEQRLRGKGTRTSFEAEKRETPTISPAAAEQRDENERYRPFPLTDIQEAYWTGRFAGFELGNVAAHGYVEVDTTGLDLPRLTQAFRRVIDRHDMLRAIIRPDGQQQVLAQVPAYQFPIVDLRGQSAEVITNHIMAMRHDMSHRVFDPARWPLFDIRVHCLDNDRMRLHIGFDALVADGRSMQILMQDWYHFYTFPDAPLPPLDYSFREYVLASMAEEQGGAFDRARAYWQERLPKLPPAPALALVRPPDSVTHPRFARRTGELDRERWDRLKRRASQVGLSPSGVLAAAFSDILALWSKNARFTLVLTLFNRQPFHPQVNDILGDFTSTVLLAVDSTQDSFEARAKAVQAELWDTLEHRYYSGVRILRDLTRLHDDGQGALLPVVFTSALTNESAVRDPSALSFLGEVVYSISQTPQVFLDHQVSERNGHLLFIWDVVEELFSPGLLDDMFDSYCRWLNRLATQEESWHQTSRALLLPPDQIAQRAAVNATEAPLSHALLHTLFASQAALRPDQTAVVSPTRRLTYAELDRLSNQVAHGLRSGSIRTNELVGIVMNKGWEQIVGVLGVLKAGAAYLPIEAELPIERIRYLLSNGEVEHVLTQTGVDEVLEWPDNVRRLRIDDAALAPLDDAPLKGVQTPDDLAYVIFTSGSTGRPKGVMIDHRGAVNTVLDLNSRYQVTSADRVLSLSSLSFDLSVYDIFGLLAAGGTIVLPAADGTRDPAHWARIIQQENVTFWNSVPALMKMLVEYATGRTQFTFPSLRLAFLSGDWIPVLLPDQLKSLVPGIEVIGLGGATEASIWSILYPIGAISPGWSSIPYGRPMLNQRIYVLNECLEPCPVSVPGQLYIGGIGLAKGYWKDPEKTASSFFHHPLTGERLYRTGDLGRYLPDGNIEFLGREDFQVKVQGHRIELGEIEVILEGHPLVRTAIAATVDDPRGDRRLVAYLLPRATSRVELDDLRAYLGARLPRYMIPSTFIVLDSLPLTPNGKINRAALPWPTYHETEAREESIIPVSGVLAQLTRIVEGVLKRGHVTPQTDLILAGANSVDMIRIVNAVENELGFRASIGEMFRRPTLEALAQQYEDFQQAQESTWEEGEL